MTTTAPIVDHIVEVASSLPTNPNGWEAVDGLYCLRAQEPLGQVLGSADLMFYAGNVSFPGEQDVQSVPLLDLVGSYVRVMIYNGSSYDQLWVGYCQSQRTVPDGSVAYPGGSQTFKCIGLGGILAQIYAYQAYAFDYSGSTTFTSIETPPFNANPTATQGIFGERSSSKVALGGGGNAYCFDLATRPQPWQAADIVNYVLTGLAKPQLPPSLGPQGITWTLSDPLNYLNYIPDKFEITGKPILDVINMLISPRRGCTWYPSYTSVGGGITINVVSCSPTTISNTVGSWTFSMPASTLQVSLDTRNNPLIQGLTIDEDISSEFDVIQVRGNHPLVAMTLAFNATTSPGDSQALIRGWPSSLDDSLGDLTTIIQPQSKMVWQRFLLNPNWTGWNFYPGSVSSPEGLANTLTVVTSGSSANDQATFGVNGLNGKRTCQSSGPFANGRMYKLEKYIPWADDGTVQPNAYPTSFNYAQPLMAPLIFLYDNVTSEAWDITDEYSIEVENDPPAIVISGNAVNLQGYLQSSSTMNLLVTIGVREAQPLVVRWNSTDQYGNNDYINDVPRVLDRVVPYCEQWRTCSSTVCGVNQTAGVGNYLPQYMQLGTMIDDTPKLVAWLQVLRAWYGYPSVSVTWTDKSQIDYATGANSYQSGALLTTVQRGDEATEVYGVIFRQWDLTDEGFGTTYTTERIIPDVESLGTHPRANFIVKSQRENYDGT